MTVKGTCTPQGTNKRRTNNNVVEKLLFSCGSYSWPNDKVEYYALSVKLMSSQNGLFIWMALANAKHLKKKPSATLGER